VTEKENALRIIQFNKPERVLCGAPTFSLSYRGCNLEGFDGLGDWNLPIGAKWYDIWGTGWQKEQEGVIGLTFHCPLAEVGALQDYVWPDPNDERIIGKIYEQFEEYQKSDKSDFLSGSHRSTLFERAYMLVGMENLMVYFYEEPEFVKELLGRIMDFQMGIAKHYAKLGIEFAGLGDDLGTQRGLLFSPAIMDEFFVPEYRRIFDFYKERNVLRSFHSCGCVIDAADTLADLGVTILNPVQDTANDLPMLLQKIDGRMALQGGIPSDLIMNGPTEAIAAEVQRKIALLGKNGGYFCDADQGLPFPEAHVTALREAVSLYGRYPV